MLPSSADMITSGIKCRASISIHERTTGNTIATGPITASGKCIVRISTGDNIVTVDCIIDSRTTISIISLTTDYDISSGKGTRATIGLIAGPATNKIHT